MKKLKLVTVGLVLALVGCVSAPAKVYYDYEVAVSAKPILRSAPDYPPAAARQGIEGYVVFDLVIAEDGDIEDIKIVESVPEGVFDSKGKAAINKWKYQPAQLNGKLVKQHSKVRLDWKFTPEYLQKSL